MMETTKDYLLNNRIIIEQPKQGYRIAVDTLLLASTVSESHGCHILDMGCGVGGVMLAIACRLPNTLITGLEIQKEFTILCQRNIEQNKFENRLTIEEGDVLHLPEHLAAQFDQVVMNPPFHDAGRHDGSPNKSKARAHTEQEGEIEKWIQSAATATRDKGVMTMITRFDRRDEMIEKMQKHFPCIHAKPIWSNDKGKCKRIILRGFKEVEPALVDCKPFILYGSEGRYSQAGDNLLRHAQEMPF